MAKPVSSATCAKGMFASDYPVCLVAGGYQKWMGVLNEYTTQLSADEQADFWGNNAIECYNLDN